MKSYLVTGATGFVGRVLCQQLLSHGHQVFAWTRNVARAQAVLGNEVCCIKNLEEIESKTEQLHAIVNLAGARILGWPWTSARRSVLHHSRVALTHQLVDWMAQSQLKPKALLSASAIGYYGIQEQGDTQALSEAAPPQSIFMSTLCQDWEHAAQRAQGLGVEVSTLRFGLILGRGGALPMMMLPIRLGLGGPLAGGRQWMSWIHLDDVIAGILHLLTLTESDTKAGPSFAQPTLAHRKLAPSYNFTAPQAVSQFEFSRTAARLLHRPCFLPTPGWLLRAALGEQSQLLLEGQRVYPEQLLKSGYLFRYPHLEHALKSLII